jgi:hypothetical protein
MAKEKLTHEYLLSILDYDSESGVFVWKVNRGSNQTKGTVAGYLTHGYIKISINRKRLYAHRLAWFYHYGVWPEFHIDHIDLDKSNNSISNLREATNGQNMQNGSLRKDNESGYKGVCFDKARNKYIAQIGFNNENIMIGRFKTLKEARAAYCKAAQELFGEFARYD